MVPSEALQAEEHSKPLADVSKNVDRCGCRELRSPSIPVQVLHVVGEHDAPHLAIVWQFDLKGISLRVSRDRTRNRKACLRVVRARREDQRWPTPALLVAGLRIEREPDEIAGIGDVAAGYHASSPSGPPQS